MSYWDSSYEWAKYQSNCAWSCEIDHCIQRYKIIVYYKPLKLEFSNTYPLEFQNDILAPTRGYLSMLRELRYYLEGYIQ